jgi:tetratricopeptide (TPR) repeat protein
VIRQNPAVRNFVLLALLIVAGAVFYARTNRSAPSFFPRVSDSAPSAKTLESKLKRAEARISKNPDDLEAVVDRGVAYYHMGPEHYADALNSFNAAWQAGAFDHRIFYYSGILYENMSFFDEAQRQYERFLHHEPGDREIRLRLARLLFRMGKWDDAVARYQEFLQENDKDVTALINCGLALQKKIELSAAPGRRPTPEEQSKIDGDRTQAIAYLENAAKLQPDLPEGVYGTLARLQSAANQWPGAVSSFEAELKKSPDQPELLDLLGQAYEKNNQADKALDAYNRLAQKKPTANLTRKIKALKKQLKIK